MKFTIPSLPVSCPAGLLSWHADVIWVQTGCHVQRFSLQEVEKGLAAQAKCKHVLDSCIWLQGRLSGSVTMDSWKVFAEIRSQGKVTGQARPHRIEGARHVDALIEVKAGHSTTTLPIWAGWLQNALVRAAPGPLHIHGLVFARPGGQRMDVEVKVKAGRLALALEHIHGCLEDPRQAKWLGKSWTLLGAL